jgi:hypothetical protein
LERLDDSLDIGRVVFNGNEYTEASVNPRHCRINDFVAFKFEPHRAAASRTPSGNLWLVNTWSILIILFFIKKLNAGVKYSMGFIVNNNR